MRIPLVVNEGSKILAEGTYNFVVKSLDSSKEDFGRVSYVLETKDGGRVYNNYDFGTDGTNERSIKAFSFFAHTVLNDPTIDEIDSEDLVGKYVTATVVHNVGNNGKTYANVKDFKSATGFSNSVSLDDVIDDGDIVTEATYEDLNTLDDILA